MTFFTAIVADAVLVLAMHLPFAFIFLDRARSWVSFGSHICNVMGN
jgi:hypothetical protein